MAGTLTRENLGYLVAKASQRWNELLYERFRRHGFAEVRPAYGSILLPLFEDDGLRMGELAARARLAKQTMTTMVRLCERDGLVERRPDPGDRRGTLVRLTRKGRAVVDRALAAHVANEERLLRPLEPADRRALDRLLRRLLAALE